MAQSLNVGPATPGPARTPSGMAHHDAAFAALHNVVSLSQQIPTVSPKAPIPVPEQTPSFAGASNP